MAKKKMKLTIQDVQRKATLAALKEAVRGTQKRTFIPVLECVLIEAKKRAPHGVKDVVTFTTTDLKVTGIHQAQGWADQPGSVLTPAKRLLDTLSVMPKDTDIVLEEVAGNQMHVTCDSVQVAVPTMCLEDFPAIPKVPDHPLITLPQKTLLWLLKQTAYAICEEETRQNLLCALLEVRNNRITVAATTGRVLSMCSVSREGTWEGRDRDQDPVRVRISPKMVHDLVRTLGKTDDVTVYANKDDDEPERATADFGTCRLVSKVSDGKFPMDGLRGTIPASQEGVVLDVALLKEVAVRASRLLASGESARCSMKDGFLFLEATDADSAYSETIPVHLGTLIPDMFVAIPPDDLLDALKHIDTDKVLMVVTAPDKPVLLQACYDELDDPEGREHVNLIMPNFTLECKAWQAQQAGRIQERAEQDDPEEEEL